MRVGDKLESSALPSSIESSGLCLLRMIYIMAIYLLSNVQDGRGPAIIEPKDSLLMFTKLFLGCGNQVVFNSIYPHRYGKI